jgi:hypothetical protein
MARLGNKPKNIDNATRAPKTLVAAAKRFKGADDHTRVSRTGDGWQQAAWHFFNTVGEYAYAVNWVGNLLSRAKLHATRDTGEGPRKVEDTTDPAAILVDALFYDEQGRSTALQQMGVHYTVAGECFIVGTEDNTGQDCWEVVASGRIKPDGKRWLIDGSPQPEDAFVMRSWRPHPADRREATSPSRAAHPLLSEIERLTMHVAAQVDSRLIGAGILFLPDRMTFAVRTENGEVITGNSDAFADMLGEVGGRAMINRDSPEANVPVIVTADGEAIGNVNLLKLWSELDEHAVELRTEAIRRLALSMDMPPEILTGAGDTSHWNAWSIDESSIKSHTEPLLNRIADDLATGYLRPMLIQEGMDPEEARTYSIGVDTTEMRLRPNRSREALELWDRGVLNSAALVEETGFRPDQIQDDAEHRRWFLDRVAGGQTQPEIVEAALRALGIRLDVVPEANAPDDERPGQHEARPTRSLEDHPDNSPPDRDDAMVAACEVLVFRALERAGNRLKNKRQKAIPGVSAAESYLFHKVDTSTLNFILEDAWSAVDRFAGKWGVEAGRLADSLDAYARAIILEQKPHDPAMMRSFINLVRETR